MAKIVRVDWSMVDLQPKVKRVDAIQSFASQETPIVRITDSDGAVGTGYSYTIGTGGPSVMKLIEKTLAPAILGRDADGIERIWRDLLFLTHATTVGAITAIAIAAIDTALWDLRCRRASLPLHKLAGGAQDSVPLYTTEGGWLHLEKEALVDDALRAQADGFAGAKLKVGRPPHEDVARIAAVRDAVGPSFEIFTDANQAFAIDEAIAARTFTRRWISGGWRSRCRPTTSRDMHASRGRPPFPLRSARVSTAISISAIIFSVALVRWCRSMSAGSVASRLGSRSPIWPNASTWRFRLIS